MNKNANKFDEAVSYLCPRFTKLILDIPSNVKIQVQEVRLRAGRPFVLVCLRENYFLKRDGTLADNFMDDDLLKVSSEDIFECFKNMCSYSVYSHQSEIKNGYITIKGGHRVGIAGTAVLGNASVENIRDISSLNIRIAREIDGASDQILEFLHSEICGTLIAGPPASGKTTILRDIAKRLSNGSNGPMKKVVIIDERGEISGTYNGIGQNDVGLCDVLNGYPKGEGIMQAIRTLSPDVIICDEVGGDEDILSVEQGLNAGVCVIASIHINSIEEALKRRQAKRLLQSGAFNKLILLKGRENLGQIARIYEVGELNVENYRRSNVDILRSYDRLYSIK